MQPHSDCSTDTLIEDKHCSSTDWTPSIIDDSEGRSSSSTLSWTDEAGSSIAEQLKQRYELFEAALYSEVASDLLTSGERAEKEIWNEFTPHLRVIGKKIKLIEEKWPCGEPLSRSSLLRCEIIAQHPELTHALDNDCKIDSETNNESYLRAPSRHQGSESNENNGPKERGVEAFDDKSSKLDWSSKTILPPSAKRNLSNQQLRPLSPFALDHPSSCDNVMSKENDNALPIKGRKVKKIAQLEISFKPVNLQVRTPCTSCRIRTSRCLSSGKSDPRPFRSDSRNSRKLLSARQNRKIFFKTEHETESASDNPDDSLDLPERQNFLPPIEALTITPQLPNKRANSAMLHFSKSQLRARPTTSRSKSLFAAAEESFSVIDPTCKFPIAPIEENSVNVSGVTLPFSSRKGNKHLHIPPRWRY